MDSIRLKLCDIQGRLFENAGAYAKKQTDLPHCSGEDNETELPCVPYL